MAEKIQRPIIESLESRILYSADPIGSILDLPTNELPDDDTNSVLDTLPRALAPLAEPEALASERAIITETFDPAPHSALPSGRLELVFVDTGAPDHEQILDSLLKQSDTTRSFEVFSFDSRTNGLESVSNSLLGFRDIDAVHIISHGEPGTLTLGNTILDLDCLNAQSEQIKRWADTLSGSADILLYGCDLASNQAGEHLVNALSEFTGADVAASDDLTAHADLGGDYELEYSTGAVETKNAFSVSLQDQWLSTLNHEADTSHDVAVLVADAAGSSDTETMSIALDNGLEANQTVPAAQVIDEDDTLTFTSGTATEVSVSDIVGATNSQMRVSLSVNDGVLNLKQTIGLTFVEGVDASGAFVIDGTESDINAALDGMVFAPHANFNGGVALDMTTSHAADMDGHYTFEPATVSVPTVGDQSAGTTQDGTLIGNAAVVNDTDRGDVLSLDGDDDSLEISGQFGDPVNVTLAAWVNLDSLDTSGSEVINIGGNLILRIHNTNGVQATYHNGSSYVNLSSNQEIAGTGWRHLAFSFDDANNSQQLYIDGALVASTNSTDSIAPGSSGFTRIGGDDMNPVWDFGGMIDDARIYSRALSAEEIGALASDNATSSASVAITVNPINDAPTFDIVDGKAVVDVGGGNNDILWDMVVQPDGKILAAGTSSNDFSDSVSIMHFNSDGSLDTTFGTNGIVITDLGLGEFAKSVALQSDGKIVVAGSAYGGTDFDFAVIRYNSNGLLDTTFSNDGKVLTDTGEGHDFGNDVAIQADGKIVVTGGSGSKLATVRYNSDGSLDTTFNTNGIAITEPGSLGGSAESVVIQADGKIVASGYASDDSITFSVVRYDSSGNLDNGFGTNGVVLTDFALNTEIPFDVIQQTDGKLLIVGKVLTDPTKDFAVIRYHTDGALDTSFGGDGMITTDIDSGVDVARSVTLQTDGKIVIAGHSDNGTDNVLAIVRYNGDGTLDTSFDSDGIVTTATDNGYDIGNAVEVLPDGKILLGGYTDAGGTDDFMIFRFNADGSQDLGFGIESSLDENPTFIEDGTAIVLDGDVDISDVELDALNGGDGNYDGARLTIARSGAASSDDVFAFNDGNGITLNGGILSKSGQGVGTLTQAAGTLSIQFIQSQSAVLSSADVDNILSQLRYSNSSDTPTVSVELEWTFSDGNSGAQGAGGGLDTTRTATVNITATNDIPHLDLDADDSSAAADPNFTTSFTEGGGPIAIADSDATLTDPDSNIVSMTLTLNTIPDGVLEVLAADTTGTSIMASYNDATGILTLNGSDSAANYQQVLRTVTYDNTSEAPDTNARIITIIVNDGLTTGNTAVSTIQMNAANDAPTFMGQGPATLGASNKITTTADGAAGVSSADIDGDGDLDVLSASYIDDTIAWYENDGNQGFTKHVIANNADYAWRVTTADVDGDGDLDVLSASADDGTVAWYENNGSQSFTRHVITNTADIVFGLSTADVDGDGDLDVLSASFNDDTVAWYENNGSQVFSKHVITNTADGAHSVTTEDVDGDGDLDVIAAVQNTGTIAWYENNGNQVFTERILTTTALAATDVSAADVDGDGDMDVLSSSYSDDTIAWYENDGSEVFTKRDITNTADGAFHITTADVDGDGDLDVVSASLKDDTIALYENDGNQTFAAHVITNTADGALAVAVADVDGDGRLDVLSASSVDDTIAWYRNQSAPNDTLGGVVSFSEDDAAVVLDSDVDIRDEELDALNGGYGNYAGASLTLVRSGGANSEDILSFSAGNGITLSGGNLIKNGQDIARFDNATSSGELVISFNDAYSEIPTSANVDDILRQITYANSSDMPPASVQMDWRFNDGNRGSQGSGGALQTVGSTTVNIAASNDVPDLDLDADNSSAAADPNFATSFTEGGGPIAIADFDATLTDPDSNIVSMTLTLNTIPDGALEVLAADTTGTSISASYNDSTGTLTLNGSDSAANYQQVLRTVTYDNTSSVPDTTVRTITIVANDGPTDGNTAVSTIQMNAENDAPTFDIVDGHAVVDVTGNGDILRDMIVQADGKILAVGSGSNGVSDDFALVRYNSDGSLDATFGTNGTLITDMAGGEAAISVLVQTDGKIVVAGYAHTGTDIDLAVVRYNSDGSLDTTFATNGIALTDIGGQDFANDVAIQADGKIVVTGESGTDFVTVRYNSNGSLDTTFGTNGIVTTAPGTDGGAKSVLVQTDGKIVVTGISNSQFTVIRYDSSGNLDNSFGTNGVVFTDFVGNSERVHDLIQQADAKLLIVGKALTGSSSDFAVARYNTDGTLDKSFGGDGKVTTGIGPNSSVAQSVTVQSDGKILLAGYANNGSDNVFAVVRYNSDGTLDTSFDGDGKVINAIGTGFSLGHAVEVLSDGKILLGGYTDDGGTNDFAVVRFNPDGSQDLSFGIQNSLDGNPTYIEDSTPVVLDEDVEVFDAELSAVDNFNGATLTLVRNGGFNVDDTYSAEVAGTLGSLSQGTNNLIVGVTTIGSVTTNSDGTLVLTFNGNATIALVNEAMQQIAYSKSDNSPLPTVQIDWTFDDGGDSVQTQGGFALQTTGSTTVNIIDVANPASLTVPISQSVDEDTALTLSSLGSNAIVIDSGSLDNPIVTVTLSVGNGTLSLNTTTGITFLDGTSDGDATMTISGTESNINSALDGLEFLGNQDYNGSDTLTVTTGSDAAAEANLHARYKFLNGSLQDETANNFDGTAVGDAVLTADAERGDVLTFDGDDRIDVANSVSTLGDEVTIAAWVKLDAGQQDNVFLSIGDEFYINLDNSNPSLSMGLHVNGFTDNSQSSTHNIAGEGWNHVAATINDVTKETYLYLNGELIRSSAFAFSDIDWNSPNSPNMTIASMSDGADAFSGSLDDIRVYNSELSRAEIIAVMGDNGYDSKTVLMTVNAVNDAPVVSGPGAAFSVNEQSNLSIEGMGFSVSDVDAASGTLTTTFSVGEGAVTVNVGNSGTNITSGNGSGVVVVTGTQAQIDSLLTGSGTGSISYVNNSDTPSASTTITVSVNDGGNTGSDPGTTADGSSEQHSAEQTININALNDAPTLDNSGTPELTAISEDDVGYGGMSVSDFLATGASGDPITDADGDPEGIAITARAIGQGIWEYSIDSGANWSSIGTVSETSALLLRDTDLVRFNPNGENAPPSDPTFEFRAWDQSTGAAGSKVDASSTGGSTAFSSAIETATISVTGVNDAPVLDNTATVTLSTQAEDSGTPVGAVGTLITSLVQLGNNVTDVDTSSQTGVAITAADTSHGSWWYSSDDGAHWNALGDVSDTSSRVLNADSNTRLYFQPDSDFNGTVVDAITFRAWDRSSGTSGSLQDTSTNAGTSAFSSATESANLTVSGVNDAPRLVGNSIVSNGEFSTDLSAWNPTGNVDHDGTQARFGQIGGANGALSQTLTTVIGETYIVSLDYFDGSATKSQSLDIGVVGSNTLLAASLDSGGAADLPQTYQFSFVADSTDSTASTLTFTDTSPDHSGVRGYLDNVSVVTDAQPSTALAYDENDGAVVVDSSIELEDVDDTHLASATIQISSNYNIGEDSLAFVDQNDISGTWVSSTGTMSLTGNATLAAYQTALHSITYTNASDAPDTTTRTVSFNVNDGNNTSNVLTRDVTVSAVNDNPVNAGSLPSDVNVTEDVSGDVDISAINLSDVDHGGGDLTLTLSTATGGNLSATSGAGVTAGGSNSGVLTLTGSLADLNTYLNTTSHLQYLHGVSNTSGNDADTINVLLNDGGNTGSGGGTNQNLGSVNVDITATDDTPTLVNNSLTLHEAETVALDSTVLSATDLNSTDSALTFSVSNVSGGHFAWASSPQSLITSFTQAQINASQVLFVHGGSEAAPSYDVMVSDGNSSTVAAAAVISFTPVNDAPLLASLGGDSQTIANDGTAALVDTGALATLVDADLATNYDAATLVITVNTFDIHDTLGISTAGPISLSAGVSNGSILSVNGTTVGSLSSTSNSGMTITFNGNSTGADINAILRAITFESTSSTLGLRSVDFVFNDGDGTANGGADTSVTTTAYIAVASADDGLVTTSEDTTYSFGAGNFDFTGVTGGNLQKITITSLPSDGTLVFNGSLVTLNQEITKAQLDAGLLTYTPNANDNGSLYAAFDFFVNSGKDSVTVLSGEPNAYTLNGGLLRATDEIIANGNNFGFGGTVSTTLSVAPTSTNINAAYLSQGNVFFNGFVQDSQWTAGELTSLDTWVLAGGVLISNSDANGYDQVSAYYGLSIGGSADTTWTVDNPSHEIMNGPFGSVGNLGDPISATESVSYFDSASLALDDVVIAVDSVSGEPTMVLRPVGSGYVLFTGDEGIFREAMTGGGTISTANDILVANIFAWATERVSGTTTHLMNIDVTAVNDDPVNSGSLPNDLSVTEDVSSNIDLSLIDLSDIDHSGEELRISMTTSTGGNLSASSGGGVTVGGDASSTLTMTGTQANLNSFINTASNVQYLHGTANTAGNDIDRINIVINDNGNTGTGGGTDQHIGTVNVDITAVNDVPVATVNTVTADEDVPLVIDASDFTFSDVENDALSSVTITGLNLNGGTLTHSAGAVTVINGMSITAAELADLRFLSALNDSTNSSFSYTVNDADNGVTSAVMNIVINAVNDAPVATGNAVVAIEDEPLLIEAGEFLFTDTESDTLSSITVSNLNLNFGSLTHSAGSVVVKNGMQISAAQLLDLNFNPALNSTLPASFDYFVNDAENGVVAATFNISISERNDTPVITSNGGGEAARVQTPENTNYASTVTATDVDLDDNIRYTLGGGADADLFEIDQDSGELRFILAPNFEQAHDADQNNRYEVEVMASDGNAGVDTQSLSFAVINSNESPTDLSLSNLSIDSRTDTAGGVVIGRLSALDEDADDVLSFALVGGADLAAFTLTGTDTNTLAIDDGVVNFEQQSSYELIVRVTDAAGLSVDRLFKISVTPIEINNTEFQEPEIMPAVIVWQSTNLKESAESIEQNEEDKTLSTRTEPDESEREISASVISQTPIRPEELVLLAPKINTQSVLAPALSLKTETQLPVKYLDLPSLGLTPLDFTYTPEVGALQFSDIAQQKRLSEDLDIAFEQLQSQHQVFVEISSGLAISLTAGFVSWTLKSGSLLASMMATVPTWKKMDPLVILTASNRRNKDTVEETPKEARIAAMLTQSKH